MRLEIFLVAWWPISLILHPTKWWDVRHMFWMSMQRSGSRKWFTIIRIRIYNLAPNQTRHCAPQRAIKSAKTIFHISFVWTSVCVWVCMCVLHKQNDHKNQIDQANKRKERKKVKKKRNKQTITPHRNAPNSRQCDSTHWNSTFVWLHSGNSGLTTSRLVCVRWLAICQMLILAWSHLIHAILLPGDLIAIVLSANKRNKFNFSWSSTRTDRPGVCCTMCMLDIKSATGIQRVD